MNRNMVYPGAIPLDTDVLTLQRNVMSAVGYLAQATLGTTTVVDGLACTPQTVANMTVNIAPGSIITLSTVDATAFGSLAADTTDPLVKMGINTSTVVSSAFGTITAPTTSGQSIAYLIEAAFQESDGTPVVLPYYNSANPAAPYSGPANAGTTQNTQRLQTVNLQLKTGTAATTGSQVTPTPDSGFVGLWVITVAYAQTTITSGNIARYSATALANEQAGTGTRAGRLINVQTFATAGTYTYTPTPGAREIVVEVQGGCGGSGGLPATTSTQWAFSAGANAGAYAMGRMAASTQTVTVGIAGAAGTSGGGTGGNGGASSFGAIITCGGGAGTLSAGPDNYTVFAYQANTTPAVAAGGSIINLPGPLGQFSVGINSTYLQAVGGQGGASRLGFAGAGAAVSGTAAAQAGNAGSVGMVIVWEYA